MKEEAKSHFHKSALKRRGKKGNVGECTKRHEKKTLEWNGMERNGGGNLKKSKLTRSKSR
jgi:hypothetical protein